MYVIIKEIEIMRDNVYFRWFLKSLRPDQLKDYNSYSINGQQTWYISFLESNFSKN